MNYEARQERTELLESNGINAEATLEGDDLEAGDEVVVKGYGPAADEYVRVEIADIREMGFRGALEMDVETEGGEEFEMPQVSCYEGDLGISCTVFPVEEGA